MYRTMTKNPDDEWRAAICYDARAVAKLLREALDDLGYKYTRDKSQKHYSKLMLVIPLPQFAYVFQFIVKSPSSFIINTYDTKPTPSGVLPM